MAAPHTPPVAPTLTETFMRPATPPERSARLWQPWAVPAVPLTAETKAELALPLPQLEHAPTGPAGRLEPLESPFAVA